MTGRALHTIAADIVRDHVTQAKPLPFGAVPYVTAMGSLLSLEDTYGADPARSVVLYALSNLATWRGPVARQVKKELREMLAA